MSTLKEAILKYSILNEGFKFDTAEAAATAIVNKKVGVKVAPDFLLNDPQTSEMKKNTLVRILDRFYRNAKSMGIDDPTYGVQFLISHTSNIDTFSKAANNDAIFEYLRSYKKPWVKQLSSYNDFVNKPFNENSWRTFEKQVQEEQNKHGKASKGSGDTNGVKILYPKDSEGWELKIPLNFAGSKAAAFYGKEGEKEEPTHWCTRADERYYNHYTDNNSHPLYIIRNYKTGKAYQFIITDGEVNFLDQNDEDGDEITAGDLSKIPDKLLSLIKGTDLVKYKHDEGEDPNKNKPGYINTNKKEKKYKEELVNNKKIDDFFKKVIKKNIRISNFSDVNDFKTSYNEFIKKYGPIVKKISKNGYIQQNASNNPLNTFVQTGKKTKDEGWRQKAGERIYFFKRLPQISFTAKNENIYNSSKASNEIEKIGRETIRKIQTILQYISGIDTNIYQLSDKDDGLNLFFGANGKRDFEKNKEAKEAVRKANKILLKYYKEFIGDIKEKELYIDYNPEKSSFITFFGFPDGYLSREGGEYIFEPKSSKVKKDEDKYRIVLDKANKELRHIFRNEIQNARQEGKFKVDAFEENQVEISLIEEISEQIGSMFNY